MGKGTSALVYMAAKGASQGSFGDDAGRAGKGRTRCVSLKFRGEVPHDVRGGKYATTRHEPVEVVFEWSPATVHYLVALWANESLDEVSFDFVRPDGMGKEEEYAHLTLTKATVAHVELLAGEASRAVDEAEERTRGLCRAGLHFEKIEFKLKDGGGMSATYERTKAS